MTLRENKLVGALAWLFGIVSVVFALCSVQMWGDSILGDIYRSTQGTTQSQAQSAKNSESSTHSLAQPTHPLIMGATRAFKQLASDNFITLDPPSESTQSPRAKLLEIKPPKTIAPSTPTESESTHALSPESSPIHTSPHAPLATPSTPLDSEISESSQAQTHAQAPKPSKSTPANTAPNTPKPKVLLIMDDLSTPAQIKSLEKLSLNITPSIFPATKQNAKTPQLAAALAQKNKTYMLHLPLEAINFEQKELEPLKTGISKEALSQALQKIRRDFPELVYINNHTGSKFTQSKADMSNLLSIIDELGFKFIDSVTTPNIASEAISREQGRLIMQRDLFLDNEQKVAYTKERLQALIKKAQKSGYVIAICHPHPSTFKALALMESELSQNLELVSPQELEAYLTSQNITQYKRHKYYATQGN